MIKINAGAFPLHALEDEYGRPSPQHASVEAQNLFMAAAPNEWKSPEEKLIAWRLLTLCAHRRVTRDQIESTANLSFRHQLDFLHRRLLRKQLGFRLERIRNRISQMPDANAVEFIPFVDWLADLFGEMGVGEIAWHSLIRDACSGSVGEWRKAFLNGVYSEKWSEE